MFRYTFRSDEVDVHLAGESVIDGLCLGGIRVASGISEATLTTLARLMSLKFAVAGIPLGGAKSAVVVRPGFSRKVAIERAARALEPFLRSQYLVGVDSGSSPDDVISIYRTAGVDPTELVAEKTRARGKTLALPDGLRFEQLMDNDFSGALTGVGLSHALDTAASLVQYTLAGRRASVQGFGNVGHAAAVALTAKGIKVVALSDVHGVVYRPKGFSAEFLAGARAGQGDIDRTALPEGTRLLPSQSWCELPAEILVPAATARCLTERNAKTVHQDVRFVVEGANDPVTVGAERLFEGRGITVLPDFVANSGLAIAFGLLVTGESTVESVGDEYLRRIETSVRACVPSEATAATYVRDRAESHARRYLASIRDRTF
ncbi:Glu/Leu/Phe/Val dehydrogenase dimerization domain-containing protein [Amycolatopsis sp. NPDC059090]|uniref:Glu/Leu/Phe/Val dehydrogenase dimerization domain-containing protein n=1 Tax=unclassified Amycolatopsis TaxID=2618356 RepID=UPI0036727AD2